MPREGLHPSTFDANLKIRRARPSDADRLAQLEEEIFPSDRMSRRSFAALSKRPSARVLVAWHGRDIAGYAILLTRCGIRSARLYSLAVVPAAAGRGVGRRLLSEVEAAAVRRCARHLRLEVRANNRRAIRLYEETGYRLIGRRPDYYSDGMTALLYARDLPPAKRRRTQPLRRAA
jgi:ribosomal protein S18 acetylase RimI-like enzyme